MNKYILILFTGLSLTACAETGRLLGNITMIPVRVVSGGANYDQSAQNPAIDISEIEQATPLHLQ